MVFFNIKSIIRLFIKACTVFAFLLLIVLCFFLIFSNSNIVSAVSLTANQELLLTYYEHNLTNTYDSFFLLASDELICWNNNPSTNRFWFTGNWLCCENQDNITTYLYKIRNGNEVYMDTSGIKFGTGQGRYYISNGASNILVGTNNIYEGYNGGSSYTNLLFEYNYPYVTPPTIENFKFSNVVNSMVYGEYFDIIILSNDFYEYPIYFYMNNGSLTTDSSEKSIAFILDENSPYLLPHTGFYLSWKIPKKDLIPIYNNSVYNFSLSYGENGSLSTAVQTLTTNFSALGLEMANVDTQDATQQTADELKEMNDFLKDDSFDNNSIINDMPSSDEYTDPSDGGLLTIFNALEDAFTDDSNTPVRFYIPFTDNKYIDLPPDLTSSHVPQVILTIIQGLYWYIICRYIIKDISKTANKAKSGELLDSKDGNIRTELL